VVKKASVFATDDRYVEKPSARYLNVAEGFTLRHRGEDDKVYCLKGA